MCSSYPLFFSLKTSHRRRNITLLKIVVTCVIIAAVIAAVSQYNKFGTDSDMNISPTTPEKLTCVKSDQPVLVSLGNQVCYSNFYIANSSKLFSIRMNLISSNYKPYEASIFVNSSEFVGKLGDWIVDYNLSRTDSRLRVIQQHVTCQSNGTYQLLLQYENGLNTTTEFEVRISDPKLEQTFTYIDDTILVTCELTEACVASSLVLYGSSGGYSYLIPSEDICSQTSKANGTRVLLKASVPKSSISAGETISCVPILTMTDQELVKNLTKEVTICKDSGCEPDCKTIPDYGHYYPDRIYCNIFYQCDNGKPVVRPCGKGTYWEPSICTCAYFNSSICDMDSKKWIHLTNLKGCSYKNIYFTEV